MPEPFANLAIERDGGIATLFLDRPEKLNALHRALWHSIPEAVAALDADADVRVIVLAGKGKAFCAGIDLMDHAQGLGGGGSLTGGAGSAVARRRQLYDDIRAYQDTCSCFANTNKPVIAAVHGACIGAGMDLITACDIRLASAEATFSVRETRIAMVADVGSLQRLPRVIGDGAAREWIFTGGDYSAQRAREVQLLNDVLPDPAALMVRAHELAAPSRRIHRSPCRVRSTCWDTHRAAKWTPTSITSPCGTRRSCTRRTSARRCRLSCNGDRRSSAGNRPREGVRQFRQPCRAKSSVSYQPRDTFTCRSSLRYHSSQPCTVRAFAVFAAYPVEVHG